MKKLLIHSTLIIVSIFTWQAIAKRPVENIGQIWPLRGIAECGRDGKTIPVKKEKKAFGLLPGDVIHTKERALFFLDLYEAQTKMKLGQQAALSLFEKEGDLTIQRLSAGDLWVHKLGGDRLLIIKTGSIQLSVLEGTFFMKAGPGSSQKVAVQEGALEVSGEFGKFELGPMTELELDPKIPPMIKGISQDDLVFFGEPFEEF